MLQSSRSLVAGDLASYGERDASRWVRECSDSDFVHVCNAGEFLLYFGPTTKSGASMSLQKALALAAVYVKEGQPRELKRTRRITSEQRIEHNPLLGQQDYVNDALVDELGRYAGVGDDFVEFWSRDPAEARESMARARQVWEKHRGDFVS